jgi:hypothetical protein
VSALEQMPAYPHADGRDFLASIGVPDADAWNVSDTPGTVGAHRLLPHGTSCEVRRRRWGGWCDIAISCNSGKRERRRVRKPDELLGAYLMARRFDEAAAPR